MKSQCQTRIAPAPETKSRGFAADYAAVLGNSWARLVILGVFLESAIMFSGFAYIGADLHARMGLSFSAVGAVLAALGLLWTVARRSGRFALGTAR